jgi:hypothetical protein
MTQSTDPLSCQAPTGCTLPFIWDGLSPHLVASFYHVDKLDDLGKSWGRREGVTDDYVVRAPLTEATMEVALNWQSPFESAGPEARASTMIAMLQSGALQIVSDTAHEVIGAVTNAVAGGQGSNSEGGAKQKSADFLRQFEGKTGITRLNSTQVFNGMPPTKITCTALFRAWKDAIGEVETPVSQLMRWALPQELSDDGPMLAQLMKVLTSADKTLLDAMLPSRAPLKIAMKYKGRVFMPLVIESVGVPLMSPIDRNGHYVELAVPLTLCSLAAIDRSDWDDLPKHVSKFN